MRIVGHSNKACRISIASDVVSLLCELGVVVVTLLKLFSDAAGTLEDGASRKLRSEAAFTFVSLAFSVAIFCVSAVGMRKALAAATSFARRVTARLSAAGLIPRISGGARVFPGESAAPVSAVGHAYGGGSGLKHRTGFDEVAEAADLVEVRFPCCSQLDTTRHIE